MSTPASPLPIQYDIGSLTDYDFFGFYPSLALAYIALALFLVAALVVCFQTIRSKNRDGRYMHLVTATGLTEAAGYIALIWLIYKSGETNIYGAYVSFQVFTVLSPNLLQAADYTAVGKIVSYSGLKGTRRFLEPKLLTVGFIVADVLALTIQAIGITLWASSKGSGNPDLTLISVGSWITVGGLAVQLFSFCVFTFLAVWVHRNPKNLLRGDSGHRKTFICIYSTIALVSIRNIYRFVEFTQGAIISWPPAEGTYVISEKEVLFYTLDALPIFLSFVFYILFNPAVHLAEHSAKAAAATGADGDVEVAAAAIPVIGVSKKGSISEV